LKKKTRSDMLLRVFFFNVLETGQAAEFLKRRSAQAAVYHDELLAIGERISGESGPLSQYGRLTLEWGLRFTEMQRDWADWALGEIEGAR
jgi:hypothetical protein